MPSIRRRKCCKLLYVAAVEFLNVLVMEVTKCPHSVGRTSPGFGHISSHNTWESICFDFISMIDTDKPLAVLDVMEVPIGLEHCDSWFPLIECVDYFLNSDRHVRVMIAAGFDYDHLGKLADPIAAATATAIGNAVNIKLDSGQSGAGGLTTP